MKIRIADRGMRGDCISKFHTASALHALKKMDEKIMRKRYIKLWDGILLEFNPSKRYRELVVEEFKKHGHTKFMIPKDVYLILREEGLIKADWSASFRSAFDSCWRD